MSATDAPPPASQSLPDESDALRLLIPVARGEKSPAAIRYAIRRHRMGKKVQVCLLYIKEPPQQWELLQTPWPEEKQLQQRIESDLSRACDPLVEHGIPHTAYLRAGSVVFAILDAAEELDCHEIVVPLPHTGWRRLFSRNVIATLCIRQRGIPVITVAPDGMAIRVPR